MRPVDRRSFLKSLAGVTAAGAFVINNPTVIAGDLLVPNPEPTIIRATEIPERVDLAMTAFVRRMNCNVGVYGPITLEMELILDGDPGRVLAELGMAERIGLYVVNRGQA